MSNLESFKDYKKLVRLSPFLVATYMGQADEIHLEEEKVISNNYRDFVSNLILYKN